MNVDTRLVRLQITTITVSIHNKINVSDHDCTDKTPINSASEYENGRFNSSLVRLKGAWLSSRRSVPFVSIPVWCD